MFLRLKIWTKSHEIIRLGQISGDQSNGANQAKKRSPPSLKGQTIARGNGRAYGDSAINPNSTIDMTACNRLLAFDPTSGQLVAEAGVSLARHHRHFRARGWFPPLCQAPNLSLLAAWWRPTYENHHKDGSFGRHVDWLDIVEADGKAVHLFKGVNAKRDYTIGGMGFDRYHALHFRLVPITSSSIKKQTITADNVNQI